MRIEINFKKEYHKLIGKSQQILEYIESIGNTNDCGDNYIYFYDIDDNKIKFNIRHIESIKFL
jgi:hypothetical protein